MVADTADGTDGVVESVLAHGRYPDGPRSQPPLAAEDDLNPECAEEGLCPTQPASECAGTLWPARPGPSGHSIAANIDADLQKVGCASRPLRSVGHELAHMGRHRVGVDEVLDRVAHARQPPEAYMRQHAVNARREPFDFLGYSFGPYIATKAT